MFSSDNLIDLLRVCATIPVIICGEAGCGEVNKLIGLINLIYSLLTVF